MLVGCATETYQAKFVAEASYGAKTIVSGQLLKHTGYSSISLEEAEGRALSACERYKKEALFYPDAPKVNPCKIIRSYINPAHVEQQQAKIISEQRKLENEYGRYITQCEYIGFKKNTDKMGECVLKLYQTEASIAASNSQKRAADSAETLTNLVILNESLKLMNPPRKNFNCQARPFGIYTNVYCN